jgi:arylsulfatase A-like enzyme
MTALLGRAVRIALSVAALFALIDLWQVAVLRPGELSTAHVGTLLALYAGGAFFAAVVLLIVSAVWPGGTLDERRPAVHAFLVAAGAFLVTQEVVLKRLAPLSALRTPAVLALAVLAALALVPLTRRFRRGRAPRWLAVAAVVLLAVGALGATRGFGRGGGSATHVTEDGARAEARPNVLLILIDTLRADHVSAYGYPRATTPTLDALAGEGVLFTHAFAQSSWTKPSTASLLTSTYPTMHQMNLDQSKLADSAVLLHEVMRAHGYETATLSGNPWITPEYGFDQGVDYFYSVYDERFARVTLLMMALRRVNRLFDPKATVYNLVKRRVQGELSTTKRDDLLGAEAARWLARPRTRPAFLYLHLMSPHHPYDPPPPFDRAFVKNPQNPPVTVYPRKSFYFYQQGDRLPPEKFDDMVGRYDGDILFVDTVLGKLMTRLRELQLLERTVVIVTSDHGEEFYDHENWGHGHTVYNELLRVPLLARFPAKLPRGSRIDEPVMSVDILPTILDLANVASSATFVGRSLVPLMEGGTWAHSPEAFSELLYRYGQGRSLVQGEKKLIETIVGDDRRTLLYDLKVDPHETRNIRDGLPETATYERRLAEVRTWSEQHRLDTAEANVSDDMKGRLKALGYVN